MNNMKSFILSTILLFAFVGVFAQQTEQTVSQDSIVFDKLENDYGTIEQGANGTCEFVFKNKGTKPLILSNVRASCGCTAPQWPQEPIEPGKTGVISVKYNTNLVGSFSKTVNVSSNAANPMVTLRIKGTVKPKQVPAVNP
jgi:hypothetical protein